MSAPLPPVSRRDLDHQKCQGSAECQEDHESEGGLVLMAKCCRTSSLHVAYEKGVLNTRCAKCGKTVVNFKIAEE